ncbi:MAG: hypothetical protein KGI11_09555 [Thaumarchaeota archaeon]|nr:hypothetical protein [Nitrososphaerota archaeon]
MILTDHKKTALLKKRRLLGMTALETEKIGDTFVKIRRDDLQKILELVKILQTRLEPARQYP